MALAAACAATLVLAPAAAAHDHPSPRDPDAKRFVRDVSLEKMTKHQQALQTIASLNFNTREVFSGGYQESLEYVVNTLKASGYKPKVDMFNYPFWRETQPPVLNRVSPAPGKVYVPGDAEDNDLPTADFITMANSPTVELTNAPVFPVGGILDPPTGGSASGCAAVDYAGVAGKVALVQRGTCSFVAKWALADEAGATGVIIYNEGNTAARQNPLFVDNQIDSDIAAVITSYTLGNDLLQSYKRGENPTVDFKVYGTFEDRFLPQVIAETKSGDPNHVVVAGGHLDSVPEGPGINDDGSGTAMLLTTAQNIARSHDKPRQKIRFMWFGAEENGLVGSSYYAANLSQAEVDKIDVMLDYDMLASPNYIRFVYDGDGNGAPDNPAGPEGSGKVEQVFKDWFTANGMATTPTPFDGRSDYVGFTLRGIPAGGVFAGAEGVKTPEEEAIYGGAAGAWYDPCYHQLCDNLQTILTGVPPIEADGLQIPFDTDEERQAAQRKMIGNAQKGYVEMAGAAAYAVWYFAYTKDPFGTRGKPHKSNHQRSRAWKAKARKRGHHSRYRWEGPNKRIRR
jgi:Zn-dependent M28 family amino/carboxypeptidase